MSQFQKELWLSAVLIVKEFWLSVVFIVFMLVLIWEPWRR